MTDNLLPCPFCGGEAQLQERMDEDLWSHNIVEWSNVKCSHCDCEMDDWPSHYRDAINAWNTRAEDPVKAELVREVERLVEQNARIVRGEFAQICSYCAWEAPAPGDSWEALQAHIAVCKNHPLFKSRAVNAELIVALEKLARLGNGEHYGNSDGNLIAQKAIAKATGGE